MLVRRRSSRMNGTTASRLAGCTSGGAEGIVMALNVTVLDSSITHTAAAVPSTYLRRPARARPGRPGPARAGA